MNFIVEIAMEYPKHSDESFKEIAKTLKRLAATITWHKVRLGAEYPIFSSSGHVVGKAKVSSRSILEKI